MDDQITAYLRDGSLTRRLRGGGADSVCAALPQPVPNELLASGALEDATGTSKDNITLELERMASGNDVEAQLAAMKSQIGGADAAPAIESAPPSSDQNPA